MITQVKTLENWIETSSPTITSLQEIVETICQDALTQSRLKMPPKLRALPLTDLTQRQDFVEYVKFHIAINLVKEIAAGDTFVQAIYYFDPDSNPDDQTESARPIDPTINLLVVVTEKTAALSAYFKVLDNALSQFMYQTTPEISAESLLNPILITEADIQQRRGYGAVINAIFTSHRKIFERTP